MTAVGTAAATRVQGRSGGGSSPAAAGPGVIAAVLFVAVAGGAALSLDVPRDLYSVKSDEATYVGMALSVAHDGDLRFERRDLERFWSLYQTGPEGLFLKRRWEHRVRLRGAWPFVETFRFRNPDVEQLYYAKALLYGVVAAPFAALAGLNGLLLFNVLLLGAVFLAGYTFVAARSPAVVALVLSAAFLGGSIAWLYATWLTHETLNFALVFLAYFCWLFKDVAPQGTWRSTRWLTGRWTDLAAAALLGLATYAKPPNVLLVAPIVLLHWTRRRFRAGLLVGSIFAAVVIGCFAATAWVAGDANYQGGDRKTFYGRFPYDAPGATFDNRGLVMATNEVDLEEPFEPGIFWPRLRANVGYFFIGRHFGFIPYFFPGAWIVLLALARWRQLGTAHLLVLGAAIATVVTLLVNMPFSWSGGGGSPGNRYFLSVYPTLFFLAPPIGSLRATLPVWAGAALFLGPVLTNPFVAAKSPWLTSQRGALRALPVELTMINDLPIALNQRRTRVTNPDDPDTLLYLLDSHTFDPEPEGIWVEGRARGDIIVRTGRPRPYLRVTLHCPIRNVVTLRAGGPARRVSLEPGSTVSVWVAARWVRARAETAACLLSVRTATGFVPHLMDPSSTDPRFLGVQVRIATAEHDGS